MVGIKLEGRLGNQMFEYAFIISVSKNKGQQYFLEKEGAPIEIYKYFKLRKNLFYYIDILFFNSEKFGLFFCHYLRGSFYGLIKKIFIEKNIHVANTEDPSSVLEKITDKNFYVGHFQSYLYFKNNQQDVLCAFSLKKKIARDYQKRFQFPIQKKKVTIHIRRTDYTELAHMNLGDGDLTLPFSYYHRLIKKIHSDDCYYIFISDDPAVIEQEFNYLPNKFISNDSAIVDFQHMLNADICIIANSTFSWWAAYLNHTPDKIVYCPKYFLGFKVKHDYPANIYPPGWITEIVN